jgi:hypothetical protein
VSGTSDGFEKFMIQSSSYETVTRTLIFVELWSDVVDASLNKIVLAECPTLVVPFFRTTGWGDGDATVVGVTSVLPHRTQNGRGSF